MLCVDVVQLVMAQPEDACQPLQGTYQSTVPGQAVVVLVRKTTQGCRGAVSLANVYNASADGGMYDVVVLAL